MKTRATITQQPRVKVCTQRPTKRLSQLRAELLRAVEAGDWLRVAELAAQLATG